VITKLFVPGEETPRSRSRANEVVDRVLALDESEAASMTKGVLADFGGRHPDLEATLAEHCAYVAHTRPHLEGVTPERRALLGAYFTHEYSTEAASLCNPSMAAHPDQSGLAEGQLRFVMTVRCIGEGHISSVGFRTGVLGPGAALAIDEPQPFLRTGISRPGAYRRALFLAKLADLGDDLDDRQRLLGQLEETFTPAELNDALGQVHEHTLNRERVQMAIEHVYRIASSSYDVDFPAETHLSERILWPNAQAESHGMEDARLVLRHDGGTTTYAATYTAYDGTAIGTHLLTTKDFLHFEVCPLAGRGARNKGMALFPRRVGDQHLALSRWDRENLALVRSTDGLVWDESTPLHSPRGGWELIQIGNGGSPIETPRGWLVITHGVGPMRTYSLGAILLDLDDPSTVVAALRGPLLSPNSDERDGYVPNVVYTCGGQLHDGVLTIPYGISDGAIRFAQVDLTMLLDRMTKNSP
jgi:predicted GH43/DUF377 family glycosyl hydrolase